MRVSAMSKPTIKELEKLLNTEEGENLQIMPDGSIRPVKKGRRRKGEVKPLTMRENLGGEYGTVYTKSRF